MDVFWTIAIGFIIGVIAKLLMPGKNEPKGFILTTILGVAGAYVATFLGQFIGIYEPGQYSGFFGKVIGAMVVIWLWSRLFRKKAV